MYSNYQFLYVYAFHSDVKVFDCKRFENKMKSKFHPTIQLVKDKTQENIEKRIRIIISNSNTPLL